MAMLIQDVLKGKIPSGILVELEGKVEEILPSFALGDIVYERFVLDDGTGKITVISLRSPKCFLPGDKVLVKGRTRPCPYAPSVPCIETVGDDIEIKEWKWIDPRFRQEMDIKGDFSVNALLQVTKFDEEVIKGVVETDLDPLKMREKFEENLSAGEDVSYLVDTLAAMTMYSIFLRDLNAAKTVKTALYMISSLELPKEEMRVLKVLEEMVDSLASREGLAPYVQPPEAIKGVVERYPIASDEDVQTLPKLSSLARKLIDDVKQGKRDFVVIELADKNQLAETRRLAEVVAGVAGMKLYYMPYTSVSSAEGAMEVVSDLKSISEGLKPGEKVLFYMEGIEMMLPSERALEMMKVPPEGIQGMKAFKAEMMKVIDEILNNATVIVATSSKMMLDEGFVEKATQVISGTASTIIPTDSQDYTM